MTFSDLLSCFYPYAYILSWLLKKKFLFIFFFFPRWKCLLFKLYSGQNLTQCHVDSCVSVRMSNFDIDPAKSLLFLSRDFETESHHAIFWAKVYCSSEATIVLLPVQTVQEIIKLEGWGKTKKYGFLSFLSSSGLVQHEWNNDRVSWHLVL